MIGIQLLFAGNYRFISYHKERRVIKTMTKDVVSWLYDHGANLVGIASVERFEGAPNGHHPCDFIEKAKSVITFGIAILHHSIHWEGHLVNSELVPVQHRKDILQKYFYRKTGYGFINDLLDSLAFRVARSLEDQGYPSLFFPATYGHDVSEFIKERIPLGLGLFSQRHAAIMAGLGEFGLNNLVVTSQYGPRVRFNSVITEAELEPSKLLEKKVCLGESCSICVEGCPGALSLRQSYEPEVVWTITPAQTNIEACRKLHDSEYCLGRCVKVCPVGKLPRNTE